MKSSTIPSCQQRRYLAESNFIYRFYWSSPSCQWQI